MDGRAEGRIPESRFSDDNVPPKINVAPTLAQGASLFLVCFNAQAHHQFAIIGESCGTPPAVIFSLAYRMGQSRRTFVWFVRGGGAKVLGRGSGMAKNDFFEIGRSPVACIISADSVGCSSRMCWNLLFAQHLPGQSNALISFPRTFSSPFLDVLERISLPPSFLVRTMSRPNSRGQSGSSSESRPANEGTTQVRNLRERGKTYYFAGKTERNIDAVTMAVRLFRRGAMYSESANVALDERVMVCKNYLASVKLSQEIVFEDTEEGKFQAEDFIQEFESIQHAYWTVCNCVGVLSASEYGLKWRENVSHTFCGIVSNAITAIGLMQSTDDSAISEHTRNRLRLLDRLMKFLHHHDLRLQAMVRCEIIQILLKTSIALHERRDYKPALEWISECETHLPCLEETVRRRNAEDGGVKDFCSIESDELDGLRMQVFHQRRACESAVLIMEGYKLIDEASRVRNKRDDGTLLLAIDALKQGQVLAREYSPYLEAQALERLAFIFRTVPSMRNKVKSDTYYQQSVQLLEKSNSRKALVLEKYKNLIHRLRKKLGAECIEKDGIRQAISFLYDEYPARMDTEEGKGDAEKVKEILDQEEYHRALRLVLSHYHPDRNGEERAGYEHHILCSEITKIVNLMYSRMMKDL